MASSVMISSNLDAQIAQLRSHRILKKAPSYILRMTRLAVVSKHEALLLTKDDEMYVLGDNWYNQLCMDGDDDQLEQVVGHEPILNPALSNLGIKDLIPMYHHGEKHDRKSPFITSFAAITFKGHLLIWGSKCEDQRGFKPAKKTTGLLPPFKLDYPEDEYKIVKVVGRNGIFMCLSSCGSVHIFGNSGKLGIVPTVGPIRANGVPISPDSPDGIVDIAIVEDGLLFMNEDGRVSFWDSVHGKLGFSFKEPLEKKFNRTCEIFISESGTHAVALYEKKYVLALAFDPQGDGGVTFSKTLIKVKQVCDSGITIGENSPPQNSPALPGEVAAVTAGTYYSYCAYGFSKYVLKEQPGNPTASDFLLQDDEDKDISFAVGPKKAVVRAHKMIMKRCDYFRTYLAHQWDENVDRAGHIAMPQFQEKPFRAFIAFLYTDKLPELSDEDIGEYLHLADYFQCKSLRQTLEKSVPLRINCENVVHLFKAACVYNFKALQDECMAFGSRNGLISLLETDFEGIIDSSLLPLIRRIQSSAMKVMEDIMTNRNSNYP